MMRLVCLAALTLAGSASPSVAQGLQGEWRFDRQGHDSRYTGTIIIDRDLEARVKGRDERRAYTYSQCGYVQVAGENVEFVFTSASGDRPYSPDHFFCMASGQSALVCFNRDAYGHDEPGRFTVTRVGDVPVSPAGRLEDLCPSRARPLSRARPSGNFG
jgi:hypothetical protein